MLRGPVQPLVVDGQLPRRPRTTQAREPDAPAAPPTDSPMMRSPTRSPFTSPAEAITRCAGPRPTIAGSRCRPRSNVPERRRPKRTRMRLDRKEGSMTRSARLSPLRSPTGTMNARPCAFVSTRTPFAPGRAGSTTPGERRPKTMVAPRAWSMMRSSKRSPSTFPMPRGQPLLRSARKPLSTAGRRSARPKRILARVPSIPQLMMSARPSPFTSPATAAVPRTVKPLLSPAGSRVSFGQVSPKSRLLRTSSPPWPCVFVTRTSDLPSPSTSPALITCVERGKPRANAGATIVPTVSPGISTVRAADTGRAAAGTRSVQARTPTAAAATRRRAGGAT